MPDTTVKVRNLGGRRVINGQKIAAGAVFECPAEIAAKTPALVPVTTEPVNQPPSEN